MSAKKTFADFGIRFDGDESRTTCPQCSPGRKKSYDRCLSVDREKGVWFCHHCGWAGGLGGTPEERKHAEKMFRAPHFVESDVTDESVLKWFAGRGISRTTLAAFHVKSGPAWMHGPNGGGNVNCIHHRAIRTSDSLLTVSCGDDNRSFHLVSPSHAPYNRPYTSGKNTTYNGSSYSSSSFFDAFTCSLFFAGYNIRQ